MSDQGQQNLDKWVRVSDVMRVFVGDWTWWKNSRCKYINIRLDTRDMSCRIYDREGKPIDLDQLKYQHEPENTT